MRAYCSRSARRPAYAARHPSCRRFRRLEVRPIAANSTDQTRCGATSKMQRSARIVAESVLSNCPTTTLPPNCVPGGWPRSWEATVRRTMGSGQSIRRTGICRPGRGCGWTILRKIYDDIPIELSRKAPQIGLQLNARTALPRARAVVSRVRANRIETVVRV